MMIQSSTSTRARMTGLFVLLHLGCMLLGRPPLLLNCEISGPTQSCVNQSEYYSTSPTPGHTYTWTLPLGGSLSNSTGASVMVNWTNSGFFVLHLTDVAPNGGSSSCDILVSVYPRPVPKIFTDFISDCQEEEEIGESVQGNGFAEPKENNCWLVCENTPVNYWTTYEPGYQYQWLFVGGTPSSATGPTAGTTWGSVGPGSVILTVTSPQQCSETKTQCVDIIKSPQAWFTINNQFPNGPIEICLGETVYFNDLSTGASDWLWDFGDGQTSSLQNPVHDYPNVPGSYFGALTVRNNCGCENILPFEIHIREVVSPVIGCVSTICLNDCALYSVTNINNCPNAVLDWRVSGGKILHTIGNSVNVIWDDNDAFIAQNGYGLLCIRVSGCETLCDAEVCVRVPVIHKAKIFGPTEVCEGEEVTYYLPPQPGINEVGGIPNGVNFHWTVTGGYPVSFPPYSNTFTVRWNNAGAGVISVSMYENYLSDQECRFEPDPVTVTVKPSFSLSPELSKTCVGTPVVITADGAGGFNWTVDGPGGAVGPIPGGASYTLTPTLPGIYVIKAQSTSGNYCPTTPKAVIEVSPNPPVPGGSLSGPTEVCANTPYTYTMSSPPAAGSNYEWTAVGGAVYGSGGQTVSVQWSGIPPMRLEVRTKNTHEPFCESDPVSLQVTNYSPPAHFIDGPVTACIDQQVSYEILTLSNFTDVQWSIQPATAGSVVQGQGSSVVNVLFNHNAGGTVQISATAMVCGTPVTDVVNVVMNVVPDIQVVVQPNACEHELVGLSVSPNTGIISYAWDFGDGSTSTDAAPTHSWSGAGSYPVSVEVHLNICGNPTLAAAGSILINPVPVAFVTASNGFAVCSNNPTTTLVVSTQTIADYVWTNGIPGPSLTVTAAGTYFVTATDPNTGCSDIVATNITDCDPPQPCISFFLPWSFFPVENCDTYTFFPNPSGADFLYWDLGDGTFDYTPGTITHNYAHVGYYHVNLFSYDPIQNCTLIDFHTIEVRYKGDFAAGFDCSSGTMVTTLTDLSEYMPGYQAVPVWFDGGTVIGSGSTLPLAALSPGPHQIHMEVNIAGNICASPVETIEVPGLPQATIVVQQSPECAGNPVAFWVNLPGPDLTRFLWDFGDGATSALAVTERVFGAPPNNYTVTLTVGNDWGCSATAGTTVHILDRGADPVLTLAPNPPVCEGQTITLAAAANLPAPVNFSWYNTSNPGVVLQGPSNQTTYTTGANGLYGVSVTDGHGCRYNVVAPDPVIISPPPYINIRGNTDACIGEAFELSADIGPGFNYQWEITLPNLSTQTYNGALLNWVGSQPGVYTFAVTVTDIADGCTNSGSTIGVVHPGVVDLTMTISPTCAPATLTANGTGMVSYNWSTGETTQQIWATEGGQYAVVVSDAFGCTTKAEGFLGSPPDLSNVMVGCYQYCNSVVWQAPKGIDYDYQWTLNGSPITGATGPTLIINESGVYTVIVTNHYGCQSESDPIDISIVKSGQCYQCKAYVDKMHLICRGTDPNTGLRYYEFWMDVVNVGDAFSSATLTSSLGSVVVDYPTNGFIPGGGALTQIHGLLYWNGTADNGCFDLLGYIDQNCGEPKACTVKWCGELPNCCTGNCEMKIKGVKAECLVKGVYRVQGTVANLGCDLFDMYVLYNGMEFPLHPSTILTGQSVTYSGVIHASPGTYQFEVCGRTALGETCCVKSSITIPPCNRSADCGLEVQFSQLECIGKLPNGDVIYDFQLLVNGVPPGHHLELALPYLGYIVNWTSSCVGATCTVDGVLVHRPSSIEVCINVLAIQDGDPPHICMGTVCHAEPHCNFRPASRNEDMNPADIDFVVQPNPAGASTVEIIGAGDWLLNAKIELLDVWGRALQVMQSKARNNVTLDVSSLPAAVYIVTITDVNGQKRSKKLIVERQ